MAIIMTRNGYSVLIDEADVDIVSRYKWYAVAPDKGCPECFYALAKPYKREEGRQPTLWMHRLIMGAVKGKQVDHINRNGMDNRRINLRICSQSQNNANSRCCSNSGYRGVLKTPYGTFRASITSGARIGSRSKNLGTYKNAEDAARAYDIGAYEAFGEFATLNFPLAGAA
jgi:hypothetical protein